MSKVRLTELQFWIIVVFLALFKLVLTSDLAIQLVYGPHDQSLYTFRAFHLLSGGHMGPYDARLFVKLPGLSFWLAAIRFLGIPYLFSINLFYLLAGAYFLAALLRHMSLNRLLLLGSFILYCFNPVTLDHQWFSILREPLSICLFVIMLAAMLFILCNLLKGRFQLSHALIFAASFAFSPLVREEDRLLYAALIAFSLVLIWYGKRTGYLAKRRNIVCLATVIVMPLVLAYTANAATRHYYSKWYGTPILHDLGQGEFPKLIAAMRSVESEKQDRLVMITQEALGKMRQTIPSLRPVIDRLPPPGRDSYSCERFGVCSEWTNGWMVFWIKDAAYDAGLTPDSVSAQRYFRQARLDIEQACKDGRLACRKTGDGLFPPPGIKWTGAYLREAVAIVKMTAKPRLMTIRGMPLTFHVSTDQGRMYQLVTMTHYYNTLPQSLRDEEVWKSYPRDLQLRLRYSLMSLRYWLRYPDVAVTKEFGPGSEGQESGAARHYRLRGQHEGRTWEDREIPFVFKSPLGTWREHIIRTYRQFSPFLQVFALIGLAVCIALRRYKPLDALVLIAILLVAFTFLRMAVLSYLSVYMGTLDPRLVFSTFVVANLLSPLLIYEGLQAARTYFGIASALRIGSRGNM